MSGPREKRIVALQKQLGIARKALTQIRDYGRSPHATAGAALDEMDAVEWVSKPDHREIHETRFKGLRR